MTTFRNNTRKQARGRRNNGSGLISPVGVLPVIVTHTFEESGGTWTLTPPPVGSSDASALKMASVYLQYTSPSPASMVVILQSHDQNIIETIPLQASVTTRTVRLRMPRSIDRGDLNLQVRSTGPILLTGRVMFSFTGTYQIVA